MYQLDAPPLGTPSLDPSPLDPSPLGTPSLSTPPLSTPPTCEVPRFAPLRVRGGRWRARPATRHRRRAVAAGLALTAAALVTAGPSGAGPGRERAAPAGEREAHEREPRRPVVTVSAPVRIADAAAVRLLRPGDRVDVVAAGAGAVAGEGAAAGGQGARIVAAGARVRSVPESADVAAEGGALVVLSVPRATAARLAGAGATSRLAVTLW
ncbi:hypothetical protein [Streptomyces antnestii]|uniref:hypothetical protein n=1 Tax=Streptomyces antnestii TaxID=2494256 RepID=UPI0026C3949F